MRQKASYMQPRFVDEIVDFHPEIHHYSLWVVFDLAPSRLGLMCTTLFWQHLLCFAAYRYKFWFGEFKHALPEEDGGSLQQSREGGHPAESSPAFLKTGEDEGGLVDKRGRNAWVVDHPPNFWTAVQQDRLEFKSVWRSLYVCVVHLMSNTRRMYSIGKNVDWSYSTQLEALSCTFSFNYIDRH